MNLGIATVHAAFLGGIERYAHDLAVDLRARGHRVTLLTDDVAREDFAAGFDDVRPLAEGASLDVVYAQKLSLLEGLPASARVVLAAHDHDDTCVRSHRYLPLGHAPCDRAPGLGCITHGCVLVRDHRPRRRLPVRLADPFALRARLAHAARRAPIVACSRYVAARLHEAGADRVDVVNPIPRPHARPVVERPRDARLLVVAQLVRGKGVDLAIDALADLPHATLSIAGDGAQRAELEARARPFGDRVRFLGRISGAAVVDAYDAASIVLVPSRWPEPFGMVGIEAMRRGRPVVGAAHGGIPEWLSPNGGALVPPNDPRALARAVRALLDDPTAGDRARADADARFDRGTMVASLEAILARGARA